MWRLWALPSYLVRVLGFAVLGLPPRSAWDVPVWAMAVPFRQWRKVVRYNGMTFEEVYAGRITPVLRRLLPLRTLYLLFLLLWPVVVALRCVARLRGPGVYLAALRRPDLAMAYPKARFLPGEIAWSRPDYPLAMYYAWEYARRQPAWLGLDDKRRFGEACDKAGLPVPACVSAREAVAKGGRYMIKDPHIDSGGGVLGVDAADLQDFDDERGDGEFIIQERLDNHPSLLAILPVDAPLSTLRVYTLCDGPGGAPRVVRAVLKLGRAGRAADNAAQGGLWVHVDIRNGTLRPGITKTMFGRQRRGQPLRARVHPDSGKTFVGRTVPLWAEAIALAETAHRRLAPEAIAAGWDVGLTTRGPVLIEVNLWTISYDYEPLDDTFTPSCQLIVDRVLDARRGAAHLSPEPRPS